MSLELLSTIERLDGFKLYLALFGGPILLSLLVYRDLKLDHSLNVFTYNKGASFIVTYVSGTYFKAKAFETLEDVISENPIHETLNCSTEAEAIDKVGKMFERDL